MGVFVNTTVTVIAVALSSLFAVSQAACSLCPFQWSEHQHHCYQYFPSSSLPYDQAEDYCRRQNARRFISGGLTAVSSLDEITFIMKHVGDIMKQTSKLNVPDKIWLNKASRSYDNYSLIYYNALNADPDTDANFTSCNISIPAVVFSLSETGTGSSGMVPAPEVVEHKCAVYVGEGAYTDLGDFAGTCVSDPDVCVSQTVTWSLWMKIHPSMLTAGGARYFVSIGGRTTQARGVSILFIDSTLRVGVRSERPDASWIQSFTLNWIPIDAWFHVVVIGDINYVGTGLFVYVDGNLLTEPVTDTRPVSPDDKCTRLYLGAPNSCDGTSYSSVTYGSSAAYSNLMVFDRILTPEQIQSLHACGSLDWGLKVRSLHLDAASVYSGNLRYVCKASASTGPTIYWRVYHADQAQWEDLDLSTGAGVDITPTSFSTCVVQSVLVIDRSRGPSSQGDIISCTASSGSLNASVYIRQGEEMTYVYNDHNNDGDECVNPKPLGLGDGSIPDCRISASSVKPQNPASEGRLNYAGYWVANITTDSWIEVDLLQRTVVTGVITQGGFGTWCVTQYKVAYMKPSSPDYKHVTDVNGDIRVFDGNLDDDDAILVTRIFYRSILATAVRVEPVAWHQEVAMRLELLGCRTN